ncbi:hypothetical protein Y958_12575 [Nitrospirillum viridazoti CBAmc]|uniref:Uncharacterized protein n=1 Tax=Nitrospirillum viridazoti CBAmc TaxID=1441467 RepID=A0A248JS45_9PROT|nr:hypothetical protein Y958_12575 [Nitrospirillum amazonense CBAmc]
MDKAGADMGIGVPGMTGWNSVQDGPTPAAAQGVGAMRTPAGAAAWGESAPLWVSSRIHV